MRMMVWTAALTLAACFRSGAPVTPVSVPRANAFEGEMPLQMTVRGASYSGTVTLQQRNDSVSGPFRVVGPGTVQGTAKGRINADHLSLEVMYAVTENGCKGTLRMNGPFDANRVVQGAVEADDSCVGRMTGTFTLGKQ